MNLTLLGVLDVHAFTGIDNLALEAAPRFKELAFTGDRWTRPTGVAGKFINEVEAALGANWNEVDFQIDKKPFPLRPVFGGGVKLCAPSGSAFVDNLRRMAIDVLRHGYEWGAWKFLDLAKTEKADANRITFDDAMVGAYVEAASITVSFWFVAPGYIEVIVEIEHPADDFRYYWYPIVFLIEFATYSVRSVADCYLGTRRTLEKALNDIPLAGDINRRLVCLREAFVRYVTPALERRMPSHQVDELETGFYPILRCDYEEDVAEIVRAATSQNEYVALTHVPADGWDSYIGWSSACIVSNRSEEGALKDEKPFYNAKLCTLVYTMFFFYERHLGYILSTYVFDDAKHLSYARLSKQRAFGDAINYFGDLRTASQYGSDRRFYEAYIAATDLDRLKKKTEDGLGQILLRLGERRKALTSTWAKWLAFVTGVIGFSSILGWITSLQSYFKSAADKRAVIERIIPEIWSTKGGLWLVTIYGFFFFFIAVSFIFILLRHRGYLSLLTRDYEDCAVEATGDNRQPSLFGT